MAVHESLVVSTHFTEYGMPSVEVAKPLSPPLHLYGLPNAMMWTLFVNNKTSLPKSLRGIRTHRNLCSTPCVHSAEEHLREWARGRHRACLDITSRVLITVLKYYDLLLILAWFFFLFIGHISVRCQPGRNFSTALYDDRCQNRVRYFRRTLGSTNDPYSDI